MDSKVAMMMMMMMFFLCVCSMSTFGTGGLFLFSSDDDDKDDKSNNSNKNNNKTNKTTNNNNNTTAAKNEFKACDEYNDNDGPIRLFHGGPSDPNCESEVISSEQELKSLPAYSQTFTRGLGVGEYPGCVLFKTITFPEGTRHFAPKHISIRSGYYMEIHFDDDEDPFTTGYSNMENGTLTKKTFVNLLSTKFVYIFNKQP